MIKWKRVRHICVTSDSRVIRMDKSIDFRIVFVGLLLWTWWFFLCFLAISRCRKRKIGVKLVMAYN